MTLKKCPNCGAHPKLIKEEDFLTDNVTWAVLCANWRCENRPKFTAATRKQAEDKWGYEPAEKGHDSNG